MKSFFKTMILASLALGFTACDKSDLSEEEEIIDPEVENSNVYVEFRSELRAYAGSSDADVAFNQFYLFGINSATGAGLMGKVTSTNYLNKIMATRNADDETMWDYNATGTKNGNNGLWKWASFKNPVSFWGVGGDDEALKQYMIGYVNRRPTLKVQLPMASYDSSSKVAQYHSQDMHDLFFGCALNCSGTQYLADTSMVHMPFLHILPRVGVRASVGGDALEVKVHQTTLVGLCTAAEYTFMDVNAAWQPFTPTNAADDAVTEIQLSCAQTVTLQPSLQPLCDKGKEAYVIPQAVKPWTTAAAHNGMGIRLSVQVRSKSSGEYLVGSASTPADVFMPLQAMNLVSGTHYDIDITFTSLYDANGNPNGYQLTYQPTVNPWVEDTDNLVGK